MMRLALITGSAALATLGLSMVFMEFSWFRRASLQRRLAPYAPSTTGRVAGARRAKTFKDVVEQVGDRIFAVLGERDTAGVRLRRVHDARTAADFRVRQVLAGGLALLVAAGLVTAVALPVPMRLLMLLGAPALVVLGVEQALAGRSARWQKATRQQLPVIAEQFGLLLGAGTSVSVAIDRMAQRATGPVAADLRDVSLRIRQGAPTETALTEWANRVRIDEVEQLVRILSMERLSADITVLLDHQIELLRQSEHERLIAQLEKRAQQVWIPVAIATLVPGMILVAIPFTQALKVFSETP